jgi:acetyl-CoA C-acetyltransferase/acetyl-CoA acyltransferase
MQPLHIIAGIRTPFCRMGSDLDPLDATDLGRHAASALLTRTGIDPGEISEVIFGCVAQPVDAANVARVLVNVIRHKSQTTPATARRKK